MTVAGIQYPAPKANRPPLRTFDEIAEEFGVSKPRLVAIMAKRPDHPRPVFKHANVSYGRKTWYDAAKFRAWWATVQTK